MTTNERLTLLERRVALLEDVAFGTVVTTGATTTIHPLTDEQRQRLLAPDPVE